MTVGWRKRADTAGAVLACWCIGVIAIGGLTALPTPATQVIVFTAALVAMRYCRAIAAALLGFLWAVWSAHMALPAPLSAAATREVVTVTGSVEALTRVSATSTQLLFVVDHARINRLVIGLPRRIRVRCDRCETQFRPGQRWQLEVRVKPLRRYANRGGFDARRFAIRQQIGANAYLVGAFTPRYLGVTPWFRLNALRHRINLAIKTHLGESRAAALITALSTGTRYDITQADWRVLARTGTAHLMAISGLHIGLAAAWGGVLGAGLWRWSRLLRRRASKPTLIIVCGAAPALGYALLAGLSVATQRALLMIAIAGLSQLYYRRLAPLNAWLSALAIILCLDPLASLDLGLWMSFVAVLVIILVTSHAPQAIHKRAFAMVDGIRIGVRVQLALWLLLAPFSVLIIGEFNLWAPLANAIAVPVASLAVVPLVLIAVVAWLIAMPGVAASLWWLAAQILRGLWSVLDWMASAPGSIALGAVALGLLATPGVFAAVAVLPRGFGLRAPAIVSFLCVATWLYEQQNRTNADRVILSVLDVGQGLGAVVRYADRVMVFDTGRSFPAGGSIAEFVIAPWLQAHGIKDIDLLVLSHVDDDHAGGRDFLIEHFAPRRILSSFAMPAPWRNCHREPPIDWGAVQIIPLAGLPNAGGGTPAGQLTDNDASCVLLIRTPWGRLLLTGDIEAARETQLVASYGRNTQAPDNQPLFPVDILMIPHHGSRTSSTIPFIHTANPLVGLTSTASGNRYGHPDESVITRYRLLGVATFDTSRSGEITVSLSKQGIRVGEYRRDHRRFWHAPRAAQVQPTHFDPRSR